METHSLSDDLIAYARAIAPHVDRLAIAVHRHGRPAAKALLQEFGLTAGTGILIDARAILLGGPITLDDLAVLARYAPREQLAAALDQHVGQGLLAREESGGETLYRTTVRGRDFLLRLTDLQGATISALWAARAKEIPPLVDSATRAADYAAATLPLDRYPAFRGQHAAPAPLGATPAHLLLARLTALRCLRADAHALAWQAHGLDACQIGTLTTLWSADHPLLPEELPAPGGDLSAVQQALGALEARGLIASEDGHWRLTPEGRTSRERIEDETDRAAAPPFIPLDPGERASFLAGLSKLPS